MLLYDLFGCVGWYGNFVGSRKSWCFRFAIAGNSAILRSLFQSFPDSYYFSWQVFVESLQDPKVGITFDPNSLIQALEDILRKELESNGN